MLQNLVPDTPYNITVEAVYPEGPGGSLTGPGRTGENPEIPEVTCDPRDQLINRLLFDSNCNLYGKGRSQVYS